MKVAKYLALASAVALSLAAMSSSSFAKDKGLVGVMMPTDTAEHWVQRARAVKEQLESLGYTVDLRYAQESIKNQSEQIENEIAKKPKALIITAIDGTALTNALKNANNSGTLIIAFDRLIKQTPNVNYYTTFDNYGVGVIQANSLIKGLKERFPNTKPWNVELFGGAPDDNNAFFFYNGALSVLQPLINNGTIKITSGQTGMDKVGTLHWDVPTAQSRMNKLLSANYSKGSRIDGILSPNDTLARGLIESLRAAGYGASSKPWPIITGQDAEVASVKAIAVGEQYSTVFKDSKELARSTAQLVDTVLSGKKPAGLDEKTYNNDVKIVPSILLKPIEVDHANYQKIVVDSGYVKADELK